MNDELKNQVELEVRRLFGEDAGKHREFLDAQLSTLKTTITWVAVIGGGLLIFFLGKTYSDVEGTVKSAVEQRMLDYKVDEQVKARLEARAETIISSASEKILEVVDKEIKGKVASEAGRVLNETLAAKVEALNNIDLSKTLLPSGIILPWIGPEIPPGWVMCDGKNGTPDLRERFLRGARGKDDVRKIGGNDTHTHIADPVAVLDDSSAPPFAKPKINKVASRSTEASSSLPPFFTVVFIMKAQ
jgi:hypothetical protein